MLTPIYLTDDDGNKIEQTSGSGDYIIIGYIESSLFADTSGELRNTFLDIVRNTANAEEKAEVIRGLRLAKSIRGRLNRFELSGTPDNAYVKYNHSIFGGRFQSQFTALGAIAGTYLRRGGSAFTKELVEAALVTGPFANFSSTFPSVVLPGDVALSVNAGGGTPTAFTWTFDNGVDQPTTRAAGASITETLTEGTWTVSCVVAFDGGDSIIVEGRTLEVSALAVTAGLTNSNPTPALGESTLLGLVIDDTDLPLLQDIEWSFNVELAAGQRVELTEDVDYTINAQSGKTVDVTFFTAGTFEVSATVTNTAGIVVSTQTNLDVADYATTNTVTNNSILSQATADALVQGDTHVVILGDSINFPNRDTRWRMGMANSFRPARWAGIQPANSNILSSSSFTNNNAHDGHRQVSSGFTTNRGANGISNLKYTGLDSTGTRRADERLGARRTIGGSYLELEAASTSPSLGHFVTARAGDDADILLGRLQSPSNAFYRASSVNSRALLYNLDNTITLTGSASDATSDVSLTMNSEGYNLLEVERDATSVSDSEYSSLSVTFDSIAVNDIFGWMDNFVYSPSIDGLSISYLGDGGYNTSNHVGDLARVNENTTSRQDEFYTDDAVVAHLDMVAWKNKAQTTLRDNVAILFAIQNNSGNGEGHDGQMRKDLLSVKARWEAAADVVDSSGALKAKLRFIILSMPDIVSNNRHGDLAAMIPDIAGLGGYSNVEFIDLHNAIKTVEGGIYADPNSYTGDLAGGTGTIDPLWYGANNGGDAAEESNTDSVHPTRAGSLKQMEILWSVIKDAASDPTGFSFSINAPANGTTDDTYNYTLSGSLPADRLVTWSVDGSIVAYGDSYTLPSVAGDYVVSAQVDGVDGSVATATASSVNIAPANNTPAFVIQPRLEDDEEPIIEGGAVTIQFRATDSDGGTLEYFVDGVSIGSFIQGTTIDTFVTAGTAGVLQTVNVTVSDGTDTVAATPLTFTPAASNTAPTITGSFSFTQTPATVGDTASFTVAGITDVEEGTALSYIVEVSIDGGAYTEVNGSLSSGTVIDGGGLGIISTSHTTDAAGDHIFRLTVTDSEGATDAIVSQTFTVSAASAETLVWEGEATRGTANAWIGETTTVGSTYWSNRALDSDLVPLSNFVVTSNTIRWFTDRDGGGYLATNVPIDTATNGTHEVRMVNTATGETFVLSDTFTFITTGRVDWAAATSGAGAVGDVQGSLTGQAFINELRNSGSTTTWKLQYWEL